MTWIDRFTCPAAGGRRRLFIGNELYPETFDINVQHQNKKKEKVKFDSLYSQECDKHFQGLKNV